MLRISKLLSRALIGHLIGDDLFLIAPKANFYPFYIVISYQYFNAVHYKEHEHHLTE